MNSGRYSKFLFLNQVSGSLFRELAEDVANQIGRSDLLTGYKYEINRFTDSRLTIIEAPEYDRKTVMTRFLSWIKYFIAALRVSFKSHPATIIFIVSNPPFLPLIGYLLNLFRRQRYVVLVYDIYPDILESLGEIKKNGFIALLWRAFNRHVWGKAEIVFTIGEYMRNNINTIISTKNKSKVIVIPNWADESFIKPIVKEKNWFAIENSQINKLTIQYSGNIGNTNSFKTIIDAAIIMKDDIDICFMIIGTGSKWGMIKKNIIDANLTNVMLLPFQKEDIVPFSLATADIAIITLEKGIEGLSVPSKTAYAMASGAALITISCGVNEISDVVTNNKCGINIEPGDSDGLARAIRYFKENKQYLSSCKENSRKSMELFYSRKNIQQYISLLLQLSEQ